MHVISALWHKLKSQFQPPVVDEPSGQPVLLKPAHAKFLLCNINSVRREYGLSCVMPLSSLCVAAQSHAEWMAASGKLQHLDEQKNSALNRVAGRNPPRVLAEVIAGGFTSPEKLMFAATAQSGARRSILNPSYTLVGYGRCDSYWCLLMAVSPEFSRNGETLLFNAAPLDNRRAAWNA